MKERLQGRPSPWDRHRILELNSKPVLITGGAGFIGTNLASRLLSGGQSVYLYDSLTRPGVETNLQRLQQTYGSMLEVQIEDVRRGDALKKAVARASYVVHLAAQVAVTTSLEDPVLDFEVNVHGTMNLLEALRSMAAPPPLLFTSTNKVYGSLEDVPLSEGSSRYELRDSAWQGGIDESRTLEFHSPYGCSKGTADQYVLDYAKSFGIPAVVFRMSCIYGPHQLGTEDQGWVAHFLLNALRNEPITIYGNGKQVRDILYVEDLVDAILLSLRNIRALSGQAFNIGGGPSNSISLLELLQMLKLLHGEEPRTHQGLWRRGDQRYYVSNTARFENAVDWRPGVGALDGIRRLYQWLVESPGIIQQAPVGGLAI